MVVADRDGSRRTGGPAWREITYDKQTAASPTVLDRYKEGASVCCTAATVRKTSHGYLDLGCLGGGFVPMPG